MLQTENNMLKRLLAQRNWLSVSAKHNTPSINHGTETSGLPVPSANYIADRSDIGQFAIPCESQSNMNASPPTGDSLPQSNLMSRDSSLSAMYHQHPNSLSATPK